MACVSSSPIRQDCRLNYTSLTCTKAGPAALEDGCSNKYTATTCNSAPNDCVYDPYLNGNCFASMSNIMKVFDCSYWSATEAANCNYHPCLYLTASSACDSIVTTGNTGDNSTSFNFANVINFLNPIVAPGTTIFNVTISTPFALPSNPSNGIWPYDINWSQIQILFPVQNVASYATQVNPQCSTLSANNGPPPFLLDANNPYSITQLQQTIYNWTTRFGNLNFDNSPIGLYIDQIYNNPLIGNPYIIKKVSLSSDATLLQYTFSMDLNAIVANCGLLGAALSTNAAGRTYTFPISYIEQSQNNGFVQYTQVYTITILTSGVISISGSTIYPEIAFPIEVVFPQMDCPAGSARQSIRWSLSYRNVFDSTKYIGPRYGTDIATTNSAAPGVLQNCYGDQPYNFTSLGCDYANYMCAVTFITLSRCRQLTADGLAFNKCSYGNAADRISDMGGNFAYPTALDGKHSVFVNVYSCPATRANDNFCGLIVNSAFNAPDQITATIQTNQYSLQTSTLNPFQVQGGILPYATAPISSFSSISDTYFYPSGLFKYDYNLFSSLPLTVIITFPTQVMQQTFDLRIQIDTNNFTLTPIDTQGNIIVGKPVLNYASIRNSVTYTTKNDFDNGCGAANRCAKLPACTANGLLGCDGFSISTSVLRNLATGNGYQLSINYKIGLTNPSGATPNARTLLAFESMMSATTPTDPMTSTPNNLPDIVSFNNTVDFSSNFQYFANYYRDGQVGFSFVVPPSSTSSSDGVRPGEISTDIFNLHHHYSSQELWNEYCCQNATQCSNDADMYFTNQCEIINPKDVFLCQYNSKNRGFVPYQTMSQFRHNAWISFIAAFWVFNYLTSLALVVQIIVGFAVYKLLARSRTRHRRIQQI